MALAHVVAPDPKPLVPLHPAWTAPWHGGGMSVRLRTKDDPPREVAFADDETYRFTAQDFPDGHVEITQTRRGASEPGEVITRFTKDEVDRVIDNGWPSDN